MGLFPRVLITAGLALASGPAFAQADQPAESHRTIVFRALPQYPELAHRMHISGDVVLRADVLPDGAVSEVHAVSGHPLLRNAAEQAVSHWRWAAQPDLSIIIVTVSFRYEGS